jgi:hypothetical protein
VMVVSVKRILDVWWWWVVMCWGSGLGFCTWVVGCEL